MGAPAAVGEGTGTAGPGLVFPVALSAPSGQLVRVSYATGDGTATAGSDYTPASGTLSIPAGRTGGAIVVPVLPDAVDEDDETLTLTLSSPDKAVLGAVSTRSATGTITDDDTAAVSVTGTSVLEGAAQTTSVAHAVLSLSTASTRAVTVSYATMDGTAVQGSDYTPAQGVATIPAGARTALIPVTILGDGTPEANETLSVLISSPSGGAVIAAGGPTATITIRDDDGGAPNGLVPADKQPTGAGGGLPPNATGSGRGVALGRLRYDRATGKMRFAVTCPKGHGRCQGTLTVFTVPAHRSKVTALRRERKLGTKRFSVARGASTTAVITVPRRARRWVRRARAVKVMAYAVARDARGTYSTAKVAGTLRR